MSKRVVVTGLGAITSIGKNVDEFWNGIQNCKSGIGPITYFDPEEFPAKVAAQVKDFKASDYFDRKEARKMARFSQYAVAASVEAVNDAGLTEGSVDPDRYGVILGNGIGGFEVLEESYQKLFDRGPGRIVPMLIPKLISNIAPGNVAIHFGAKGPCYAVVTACASATDALGAAARWIREGKSDVIISGGAEGAITQMGIGGFCVIQALSTKYNDTPEKSSRPFDKDRDGFVMGEGAGILVLEELEHAKKRGAKIYCELAGYGMTCDANHLTAPHPEGIGAAKAMKMAVEDAGLKMEDIDYINAHGTSTPINDPTETKAIKKAFGDHAYKLKVSSTKSMTGHCIGAAGGIEALASVLAIRDQYFPATINLDEPDPECDLDYVPNKGQEGRIRAAMSNSLGFGGHNGIVVFKEFTE
ncbi:MAG: beta-ketoacyl-ACP synthase II [Spirochaetia bacterium]